MKRTGTLIAKRFQLALGLVFWCLSFSYSQPQSSLLWEVSGNGLTKPSYVFGTIHLLCEKDFPLSDSLLTALKSTGHLLLEMDVSDAQMVASLINHINMRDGQIISDLMTDEEYSRLDRFFRDSIGIEISLFPTIKPYFLSSLIFARLLPCPPASMEDLLANVARLNQISVGGLEQPEDQAAIVDSIPYDKQARLILSLADSLQTARDHFTQTIELYKAQDIEEIYNKTSVNKFDFAGFDEVLLNTRNRKWIPVIEENVRQHPTFIAVGAAHLGGEEGLISLLRKRGYTLRPVSL